MEAKGEMALVDLLRVADSKLDIADCGFETIPAEVTCWPRTCLQQLKLSGNRLTDLPQVSHHAARAPKFHASACSCFFVMLFI